MDPDIAKILASPAPNPYASPAAVAEPASPAAQAAPPARKEGSMGLIILGVVLLLVGYFVSNLFLIGDLYGLGIGPRGKEVPSPLAEVFTTPGQRWLAYGFTAVVTAAGCVLLGSQRFHSAMAVVFFMCPIATIVFIVGFPLRAVERFAIPLATVYLAIGTCFVAAGGMQLFRNYGANDLDFEPFIASLLTEAGLALIAGAVLKLWVSGALATTTPQPAGHFSAAG